MQHSARVSIPVLLLLMVLLSSCGPSAKFELEFSVPKPVIRPLPIKVATYYPQDLKQYIFEEEIENYGKFQIDMSGAHETLFETVFEQLFEDSIEVTNFNDLPSHMDGLVSPTIDEVQIALPQQTRSEYYEVWIRYKLHLVDKKGNPIHTWGLPAYGKAHRANHTGLSNNAESALHEATELALRDAAASISFFFAKEPPIEDWITRITKNSKS